MWVNSLDNCFGAFSKVYLCFLQINEYASSAVLITVLQSKRGLCRSRRKTLPAAPSAPQRRGRLKHRRRQLLLPPWLLQVPLLLWSHAVTHRKTWRKLFLTKLVFQLSNPRVLYWGDGGSKVNVTVYVSPLWMQNPRVNSLNFSPSKVKGHSLNPVKCYDRTVCFWFGPIMCFLCFLVRVMPQRTRHLLPLEPLWLLAAVSPGF